MRTKTIKDRIDKILNNKNEHQKQESFQSQVDNAIEQLKHGNRPKNISDTDCQILEDYIGLAT